MKRTILNLSAIALVFSFTMCTNEPEEQTVDSTPNQNTKIMNSYISIFEIPATDISRAVNFYQNILNIKIETMEFPGMEMGLLPYENQTVTGVIAKGEGYEPSATGITIYLNGGDNLQTILDKVPENGGEIIVPKTPHADESGYFALFLDSEGNKMGLHSPN